MLPGACHLLELSDADTMHSQTQNRRITQHLNTAVSCLIPPHTHTDLSKLQSRSVLNVCDFYKVA